MKGKLRSLTKRITFMTVNKKAPIFFNLFGLILVLIWSYILLFRHYSWADANQIAFHLPLIVLWCSFFLAKFGLLSLGIMSWISYLISDFGLIDEELYFIFLDHNLFPNFITHHGFVNPQYMKILLYVVSLFFMAILLIFKKQRTTVRSFSFLSALGCLVVTLAIHQAIPSTTLKWEREIALRNMASIITFIYQKPSSDILAACEAFQLSCHPNFKIDDISTKFEDPKVQQLLTNALLSGLQTQHFEFERLHDEKFFRQIFGVIKSDDGTFTVLIEENIINQSQNVSEEAFGKLATFANLVWGQLFLLIGIFHTSERRKKVFNN